MTRAAHLVAIPELVAMLTERLEALVAELLPAGRREGAEWVEASRARGGMGDSLKVCLVGAKRGVWAHFAAGPDARGDVLDLIAYIRCDGDKRRAIPWARAWLGMESWTSSGQAPAAGVDEARRRRAAAARAAANGVREEQKRRDQALGVFLGAREGLAGTPVDLYLRSRAIELGRLGRTPRSLRYHPALTNTEAGRQLPAMVAAIIDGAGRFISVHRTWLAPLFADGPPAARQPGRPVSYGKARLEAPKKTLGAFKGGAIHLWRGEVVDPKTGEIRPAPSLGRLGRAKHRGEGVALREAVLTEGIEDGLTVALACPERRVLCAVALGNMGQVALPPAIETVIICCDNDDGNIPAVAALDRAISAHQRAGRKVRLARPPAQYHDINEVLAGTEGAK